MEYMKKVCRICGKIIRGKNAYGKWGQWFHYKPTKDCPGYESQNRPGEDLKL